MTDDARGVLTEEERARIHAARKWGGMCARCGRTPAPDEPVWLERTVVGRSSLGKTLSWWAPVGRECATPETVRATEGDVSEACGGCGRGVYQVPGHALRRATACSKRCAARASTARAKERRQ